MRRACVVLFRPSGIAGDDLQEFADVIAGPDLRDADYVLLWKPGSSIQVVRHMLDVKGSKLEIVPAQDITVETLFARVRYILHEGDDLLITLHDKQLNDVEL